MENNTVRNLQFTGDEKYTYNNLLKSSRMQFTPPPPRIKVSFPQNYPNICTQIAHNSSAIQRALPSSPFSKPAKTSSTHNRTLKWPAPFPPAYTIPHQEWISAQNWPKHKKLCPRLSMSCFRWWRCLWRCFGLGIRLRGMLGWWVGFADVSESDLLWLIVWCRKRC